MKKAFKCLLLLAIGAFLVLPFSVKAETLLTSLEIEGIGQLGLSRKVFNLGYQTPFDYVNIKATAPEGVTIEGAGKVPVNPGHNTIVVKASNETATDTYTINLNVTKKGSAAANASSNNSEDIKNPNTGAFVSIISVSAISLIVLGLIIAARRKKLYRI